MPHDPETNAPTPVASKLAFLIQAHTDPALVTRLVRTLAGHDVFIHWDAKSGPAPNIPGATVIAKQVHVFWAGFTQVIATMELLRAALSSGTSYSRLVLLSGACYPIRPIPELAAMFETAGDRNFINAIRVANAPFLIRQTQRWIWRDGIFPRRLRRTHRVIRIERIVRASFNLVMRALPRRAPPIPLFHGSSWWALTPEAAAYVLQVFDTRPNLRRFFAFTFSSDEKFIHSVLRSSLFSDTCDPAIPDDGVGLHKTANFHIIDPSLTKWFDENDIPLIQASDKFFVRKVRSETSDRLLDWLDANRLSHGGPLG